MESITIHPKNQEQASLFEQLAKTLKVPFEKAKSSDSPYNAEFVAKMNESRKQTREGKTIKINLNEIWK